MLPLFLKKYFWDADFESLDVDKHKKYILERILEMGDEPAVKWAREMFAEDDIRETIARSRAFSKQSLNFWRLVFGKK